jgi:hypothetical protein
LGDVVEFSVEGKGISTSRVYDIEGRMARLGIKEEKAGSSAYGIRTRVTGVRGRRPGPLDECATMSKVPGISGQLDATSIERREE